MSCLAPCAAHHPGGWRDQAPAVLKQGHAGSAQCLLLVDCPLNNRLRAGIDKIYVLTQFQSHMLNSHVVLLPARALWRARQAGLGGGSGSAADGHRDRVHPNAGRRALEASLHWGSAAEGGNPWVEVVAHMCGEQGRMICLGPLVAVAEFQEDPMTIARSVSASGDGSSSGSGLEQGEGGQQTARERAVAVLAALERQLAERRRREGGEEEAATAAAAAAAGGVQQDAAAGTAAGATQAQGAAGTNDVTSASSSDAEREASRDLDRESGGSSGGDAAAPAPEAAAGPHLVRLFELTPPPSSWVQPQAVANFKLRMEMVADRLGLAGVARIEAFMNSETGDVVVTDVDPLPQLGPDALIFKQAAVEEVPFSPENVFLELLRVGLAQAQEPQGAELAGELAGYSDLEASLEADDQLLGGRDLDAPGWLEDDASWRYDPDFSQAPQ